MDAHVGTGDLASAAAAYQRCRSTLAQELGIEPSPATRERHAAILALTSGGLSPQAGRGQSRD
jgi:DNA-binding SARP family transcriptional activator